MRETEKTCIYCKWVEEDENGIHCKNCIHNAVENFEQRELPKRLIDADEVIKAVDRHTRKDCSEIVLDDDISCILEEVKTAYDVEKVVEQIKEISYCPISGGCSNCDKCEMAVDVSEAIDIIRKGGIE